MTNKLTKKEVHLAHNNLVALRYNNVKRLVEKGMTISGACKRCNFSAAYLYKNITKDQWKTLHDIYALVRGGFGNKNNVTGNGLHGGLYEDDY